MIQSPQPLWLVLVSLGITGSIAGAAIAATAGWLNDRSRKRFELRRWRAEFYLRPKLEALRNLHAALVRSHYEINMRAKSRMPQTLEDYRDVVEGQALEFFAVLTIAEIYLDRETSDLLHDVLGSVRQMSTSIYLRVPEIFESHGKNEGADLREPDWKLFSGSFDAAHARLGAILHPHQLMKWIENED
jgi:hypothetical protein